ncbi:hypothetical protein [Mycobacterium paragordonae]|uniref:Uncharacterized protein n=1 Tax=Mycobacterium paragordonae TaxID=1389713 RepID=A0AAJ1S8G7_9MYCO|nr:hypothetical protein [Mycobacterium paragordonae]MDP7739213.1 hypothetical protein [Mycobacterium paragordonae]TDL04001.1 hypothetical protein EUA05_22320 [Mycobacterium paragordonae]
MTIFVDPVAGPRWTRGRLADMLIDCYGTSPRGRVNADAVAEYVGVTAATVRRWISGGQRDRRRAPLCPPKRITQLQRGPDIVERRNQQLYERALSAIGSINGDDPIPAEWDKQQWLETHTVAIGAIHGKPWYQVAVTNAGPRSMTELRRRVTVIDALEVPTWFHAQVLTHTVMTRQQAWRVHPAKTQLTSGRTHVWMNNAPPLKLIDYDPGEG